MIRLSVVCLVLASALAGPAIAQNCADCACQGCTSGPHAQPESSDTGAPPGAQDGMRHGTGGMRQGMGGMYSMVRHQRVMREGLPDAFQNLTNPLTATESVLATGHAVYAQQCASCHGATGQGNGPAGTALEPRPSNLAQLLRMPMMSSDAYLYWTVAEGGVPVGSAMPAFQDILTTDEIWGVILAVREGIGSGAGGATEHGGPEHEIPGQEGSGHDAAGHPAAGH